MTHDVDASVGREIANALRDQREINERVAKLLETAAASDKLILETVSLVADNMSKLLERVETVEDAVAQLRTRLMGAELSIEAFKPEVVEFGEWASEIGRLDSLIRDTLDNLETQIDKEANRVDVIENAVRDGGLL